MIIRKITPIFISCVISLALIVFAVTKDKWTEANSSTYEAQQNKAVSGIQLAVQKAIEDSAEKDSDGDGIKDWEEAFKKSEQANVAGEAGSNKSSGPTEPAGPKNVTDEVSVGLFAEYMQLKQSGKLDQDTMTGLVNKAVAHVNTGPVILYSPTDIKTIPDSDTAGAKNYANSLVTIREKYQEKYRSNQIIIVGTTVNFDDPASVESINSTSKLYEDITKELVKLSVPKSLVASHVALLNNYTESFIGFKQLANLKNDPIVALVGIQKHVAATGRESEIYAGINQFFSSRGLVFSAYEAGSRIGTI